MEEREIELEVAKRVGVHPSKVTLRPEKVTILHTRGGYERVASFRLEENVAMAVALHYIPGVEVQVRAYVSKEKLNEAMRLIASYGRELDLRSPEGH